MPGISSSGNAIPASTRTMPLPARTAVMFLPISSKPPRGTTCKVLSFSSSDYLLGVKVSDRRLSETLAVVQVPPEVELLGPDGGEAHIFEVQVRPREAPYVFCHDRLDVFGDL